jgi:hypothetical protein
MILACEEKVRVYGYVDASFAAHKDMKGHTGGIISLDRGSVNESSKKQQLITKPLQGDLFRRIRTELMGNQDPGESVSNTVKHRDA